jgi:outer membrane protein assembly factor BamB
VAAYAGPVVALDAKSGARLWTNDQAMGVTELLLWQEPAHEPSSFGPDSGGARVPARSVLLAASASTGLWALDPATGREIWRNKLPDGGITAPVAVAGAVAVGTSRYGLFLLAPRNGLVIDAVDVGSGFSQTPAVVGHRLYAMSNGGTVLGVQVEPPVDRKPVGAVGGSHRFPF